MSRARLFLENFFIYGVGNVLTKAVPFLMLPVLTRMITNPAVFGVYDIYTIVIRFGEPLVILGSYDAMFRLFFDDENPLFRKQVCSSSLAIVTTTSLVALVLTAFFWVFGIYFWDESYRWMIATAGIVITVYAMRSVIAAPTRMQNQRATIIILSLLGPLLYYALALFLAWKGKPLEGLVFGNLVNGLVFLLVYGLLNRSFFSRGHVKSKQVRDLLKIGVPLAPTFLIYWIFTSCDRFMIGHMMGMEAVGLYGVGARLSAISQGIYTAFAGGWQYFAFSTMKDEDHTYLMSRIFEILAIFSFLSLFILLPWVDWIFKIMVAEPYRSASTIFPYLFFAPLLLMLSQIAGTQLQVEKKTHLSTISRLVGAVTNIILNFLFIPRWGILGAALATLIGYFAMTLSITLVVLKMNRLTFNIKFAIITLSGSLLLLLYPLLRTTIVFYIFFSAIVLLSYKSEIFLFILTKTRRIT